MLMLDPLRFVSWHLLVIVRWVRELGFHYLRALMLNKCHLSKGKLLGFRFIDK